MSFKQLIAFPLLFVLFSCKQSNPETILGLKLGLPEEFQITEAIQAGKIKIDGDKQSGDKQYVDYGPFRGYLQTWTTKNSNDIDILTGVTLHFVNPTFRHPNIPENNPMNQWVTEFDIKNLIEIYKGKYGEPEFKNQNGYEDRIWKRDDLEIKLSTHKELEFLGKIYCTAWATYSYTKDILEKLRQEEKKNNKKI